MPARRLLPTDIPIADPCTLCGAPAQPHACGLTFAQPCTFALTVAGGTAIAEAFPCAFTRALRDA